MHQTIPVRTTARVPFLVALLVAAACGVGDRATPRPVPLEVRQSVIVASDGTEITRIEAAEKRETVPLWRIPTILQNAVVAIEDERFWDHNGIDLQAIARAATSNIQDEGVSEGGSTITQQYVKNTILGPQQTFSRKIEEASLAMQLERTHSKKFILEQYLNTIYLGNRAYGVQMAAKRYFGIDIDDIGVSQAALLAGLIQQPSRLDPYRNVTGATERRDLVLQRMATQGFITDSQLETALSESVADQLISQEAATGQASYPAPPLRGRSEAVHSLQRPVRRDRGRAGGAADHRRPPDLHHHRPRAPGQGRAGDSRGLPQPGPPDHRPGQGPRRRVGVHRPQDRVHQGHGRGLQLLRHRRRHPPVLPGEPGRRGRSSARIGHETHRVGGCAQQRHRDE